MSIFEIGENKKYSTISFKYLSILCTLYQLEYFAIKAVKSIFRLFAFCGRNKYWSLILGSKESYQIDLSRISMELLVTFANPEGKKQQRSKEK